MLTKHAISNDARKYTNLLGAKWPSILYINGLALKY